MSSTDHRRGKCKAALQAIEVTGGKLQRLLVKARFERAVADRDSDFVADRCGLPAVAQ